MAEQTGITPETRVSVAILLAVRDGANHLAQQLDSISKQSHEDWHILASDDGSLDNSLGVLCGFRDRGHPVTLYEGPKQGLAVNFMFLVTQLADRIQNNSASSHSSENSWLAFCDQDDVWEPDRLARGITALSAMPQTKPALYCSRTWIADANLDHRRLSAPRPRPPGFRNALVQNIASGNTILLNAAATQLVCNAAFEAGEIVVHDWWVYQLVTGAGGIVVHDDKPTLIYRQHEVNQIGANDSMRARLRRVGMLLQGEFRRWNEINVAALRRSGHRLTSKNRDVLEQFATLGDQTVLSRMMRLRRLGLYRQTRVSTCALWVSSLLRRL